MAKFDFNKPADFAAATMSATSSILQAFQRNSTDWDIVEGSYQGGRRGSQEVLFHVFQSKADYDAGLSSITDTGGRRKAKFLFPYVDGQTTDDLGRKPDNFSIEVVLFGANYQNALYKLFRELNDPIPGQLTHPVRGVVACAMEDYQLVHSADRRIAVMVQVHFTEHSFDQATFGSAISVKSVKSALQKAIAALQAIGLAIATVKALISFASSLLLQIQNEVASFYNLFQDLLVDINSSFQITDGDVAAILPVNLGGIVSAVTAGAIAGGANPAADPTRFGSNPSTALTAGVGGTSVTAGNFVRVSTRFVSVVAPNDPFANIDVALLSDTARAAIEQTQLLGRADGMRQVASAILEDIDTAIGSFSTVGITSIGNAASAADSLVGVKVKLLQACDAVSALLVAGLASGRPKIINYTVPHNMSGREAAFLNGLPPDAYADISVLNPELESLNEIPLGTVLLVPLSR